jgi:hypothetical protein
VKPEVLVEPLRVISSKDLVEHNISVIPPTTDAVAGSLPGWPDIGIEGARA